MAGYLDRYGAGDEEREKLIKRLLLAAVFVLILSGFAWVLFKNYRQERQIKLFLNLLRRQDYQSAYSLWGCSEIKPCDAYPFDKFLEDWGPSSARSELSSTRVAKTRSCGNGVIVTVHLGRDREEKLWVERGDLTIGFSPWPGCPAR